MCRGCWRQPEMFRSSKMPPMRPSVFWTEGWPASLAWPVFTALPPPSTGPPAAEDWRWSTTPNSPGAMARAARSAGHAVPHSGIRALMLQAAKSAVFSRRLYGLLGRPMRRWVEAWALLEPCLDMQAIRRSQAAVARRQALRFAPRVERQRANSLRLLSRLAGAGTTWFCPASGRARATTITSSRFYCATAGNATRCATDVEDNLSTLPLFIATRSKNAEGSATAAAARRANPWPAA